MPDQVPKTVNVNVTDVDSAEARARRIRDRKFVFQAYEEDKRLEAHIDEFRAQREQRLQEIEARREERRARLASRYKKILVYDSQDLDAVEHKKLFSEIPRIEGDRVVLDRVVDSDADALHDLKSNTKVQRYLPAFLFENQYEDDYEAIRQMYADLYENKESLILAVRMKETGEFAGLAEFYGLRDRLHKISVGCRLRECFWRQGIAVEATSLMVEYLYGQTDIEIITASVAVENAASARVLEKCDFIRTARYVEEDWGFPEPTIVDKWFC